MRTLIGVIHSGTEHNNQLCLHPLRVQLCTAAFFFSLLYLCDVCRLSRCYEDVSVVPSHGPVKLGPLFLGSTPPYKPLPEELCHAPLSLVCRQGTQGIIHSI